MGKKIAWIEDDTAIIDPVVRPLEKAGYEFMRFRSVKDALDQIEQIKECDLILLDLILPVGDAEGSFGEYPGLELLKMIRDKYSIKKPILVFSVVTNTIVQEELKRIGVQMVRKPVMPPDLKEKVEKMIAEAEE